MKNTLGRVAHPSFFLASTTAHATSAAAILTSQNGDWWKISPSGCWRRIISRTSAPYPIFRKIHLKTMEGLFEQVLKIALEAGALKVGRVALYGTKIKATASKHKATSYDRMKKEKDLRSQINDLAQAEAADAEEDAATPVPDPCDTPPRRRMIRRELNRPTQ
jgi:hypothetical protein